MRTRPDDDDEHPGEGPLPAGHHLRRQDQTLRRLCRVTKTNPKLRIKKSKLSIKQIQTTCPELLMFWYSARNIAFSTIPRKITPPGHHKLLVPANPVIEKYILFSSLINIRGREILACSVV